MLYGPSKHVPHGRLRRPAIIQVQVRPLINTTPLRFLPVSGNHLALSGT